MGCKKLKLFFALDDVTDLFGYVSNEGDALRLAFWAAGREAFGQDAAADGSVVVSESIVQFFGEFLGDGTAGFVRLISAEDESQDHDAAGNSTAGASGTADTG